MDKLAHYASLFKDFFNVAIGSAILLLIKKIISRLKERKDLNKLVVQNTEKRFQVLERAMIAIQHDRIYSLTEEYLTRGYVTLDELDNLDYLYNSYKEQGGNGSGERRYMLVQKLPIVQEGEEDEN